MALHPGKKSITITETEEKVKMAGERKTQTRNLVIASMLTALVFVVTFLIAIPITVKGAYINLGDSIIYCTGLLIPAPWAAAACGIGSMISDWALGFTIYMPATLIIKGLMGFVCATMIKNAKFPKFVFSCIIGGAIMVVGYSLFEVLFMGGWGYLITTIVGNLIQWAGGVAGAIALYYPIKRMRSIV